MVGTVPYVVPPSTHLCTNEGQVHGLSQHLFELSE